MRCVWLLLIFCIWPNLGWSENSRMMIPKVWNGELMEADEGAFYLQGVIMDLKAQNRGGRFAFSLLGRKRQLLYVIQTDAAGFQDKPQQIWKLKDDDYDLVKVSSVDDSGNKWDWQGPYKHSFKIRGKSLSHFGNWYLVQVKQGQSLRVLVKAGKNNFPAQRNGGAFEKVIDADSGRVLAMLQAGAAAKSMQVRHVMRSSRTIGMFYGLNLFRQNVFAPSMSQVISANDPDIRSCYTDLLERGADAAGVVAYTLVYSSTTHSIKSMKLKQSDFSDNAFLECLSLKLMGLVFPINSSLIGELTFTFQLGT